MAFSAHGGRKKAYELSAFGEKLKATDCLELGLCNRVVPADKLIEQAKAIGTVLASKAPLSLRYAKEAVNAAISHDLADTISIEARLQEICANSEDAKEGAKYFCKKTCRRVHWSLMVGLWLSYDFSDLKLVRHKCH